jgi:hypothetical protein
MATSFSGGRSWREPPTMGKQLVNFITCGCESSAPFCNLQSLARTHTVLVIGLYELLDKSNYLPHWVNRALYLYIYFSFSKIKFSEIEKKTLLQNPFNVIKYDKRLFLIQMDSLLKTELVKINIFLQNLKKKKTRSLPLIESSKWSTLWLKLIRVITKLPNSEQPCKGKVKTHKYINRQNQATTGKLWKP